MSVGDPVSSNLYNVKPGEGGVDFSEPSFFLLIFNFSLRLDRISASTLYYPDIHEPYTLHRTVTSQNAESSGALREEILCSETTKTVRGDFIGHRKEEEFQLFILQLQIYHFAQGG